MRALRPFHKSVEGLEALSCPGFVGPLWGPSSNHPLCGWYMIGIHAVIRQEDALKTIEDEQKGLLVQDRKELCLSVWPR